MPSTSKCAFCSEPLTAANSDREHVLLNAIGGRKTVSGFICRTCNNQYGVVWDAPLALQLKPLSVLFGISRQRGAVRPLKVETPDGTPFLLQPDASLLPLQASQSTHTDADKTTVTLSARSPKELRKHLRGLLRTHGGLHPQRLDELMATVEVRRQYSDEPYRLDLPWLDGMALRSIVKSALALAFCAGVDLLQCHLALEFLLNDTAPKCVGLHYEKGVDLLLDRPGDVPVHCVHVEGREGEHSLVGYIELFSLWRAVICLSTTYSGPDFSETYAVDPTSGSEIAIDVDLRLPVAEMLSACETEKIDELLFAQVIERVFALAQQTNFAMAMDNAIDLAVKQAFERFESEDGAELRAENADAFVESLLESLLPFVLHHMPRTGADEDE